MERELQAHGQLDEPTAILVTEMAKLQANTVGGAEDYSVTREFTALATEQQRMDVLRACFAVGAASGSISAEESATLNQIANELKLDTAVISAIRAEFHDRLTSVREVRRLAGQG
jgi:tellurite resistance protein